MVLIMSKSFLHTVNVNLLFQRVISSPPRENGQSQFWRENGFWHFRIGKNGPLLPRKSPSSYPIRLQNYDHCDHFSAKLANLQWVEKHSGKNVQTQLIKGEAEWRRDFDKVDEFYHFKIINHASSYSLITKVKLLIFNVLLGEPQTKMA